MSRLEFLGIVASSRRNIKPGNEFNGYFPASSGKTVVLSHTSNPRDTVEHMEEIVRQTLDDTKKISKILIGSSTVQTCKKIWNFCYHHIQYKLDDQNAEQLRRPARTWRDRATGVDCDCYSIFVSSILLNLGIPHYYRVADYGNGYQHVYVVVVSGQNEIIIDPVLDQFNQEKKPINKKFDHHVKTEYLGSVSETEREKRKRQIFEETLKKLRSVNSIQELNNLKLVRPTIKVAAVSSGEIRAIKNVELGSIGGDLLSILTQTGLSAVKANGEQQQAATLQGLQNALGLSSMGQLTGMNPNTLKSLASGKVDQLKSQAVNSITSELSNTIASVFQKQPDLDPVSGTITGGLQLGLTAIGTAFLGPAGAPVAALVGSFIGPSIAALKDFLKIPSPSPEPVLQAGGWYPWLRGNIKPLAWNTGMEEMGKMLADARKYPDHARSGISAAMHDMAIDVSRLLIARLGYDPLLPENRNRADNPIDFNSPINVNSRLYHVGIVRNNISKMANPLWAMNPFKIIKPEFWLAPEADYQNMKKAIAAEEKKRLEANVQQAVDALEAQAEAGRVRAAEINLANARSFIAGKSITELVEKRNAIVTEYRSKNMPVSANDLVWVEQIDERIKFLRGENTIQPITPKPAIVPTPEMVFNPNLQPIKAPAVEQPKEGSTGIVIGLVAGALLLSTMASGSNSLSGVEKKTYSKKAKGHKKSPTKTISI